MLMGSLIAFAVVGAIVFIWVMMTNRQASGGKVKATREDIQEYAKRYLKRFPDTKPKSLRESLRQEFLPERIGKRTDEDDLLGVFIFGLGGMMGAIVGHAAAERRNDAETARIKQQIDDVIDELYEDEGK